MRSDEDIKRDVEDELKWDPDIDSADLAVAVEDGVVTLTGFARSYNEMAGGGRHEARKGRSCGGE
jgi:osmotically-inducible protein OsmY